MVNSESNELAKVISQRRLSIPLTLQELSARSGVSPSHLSRIEDGKRFPSAAILRKIAKPLGFEEDELFMLAGYLSSQFPIEAEQRETHSQSKRLDPYVAVVLAQQSVEVQRTVVRILNIWQSIRRSVREA